MQATPSFVDTNIQSSAHDSIVDARTALLLYKEYQKLAADGADKFKTILKELYDKGRLLKWKIPCTQTDDDTAVDKFDYRKGRQGRLVAKVKSVEQQLGKELRK